MNIGGSWSRHVALRSAWLLSSFYRQTTCACVQVDELLTLDPGNEEYQDLHTSLLEVLCLHR